MSKTKHVRFAFPATIYVNLKCGDHVDPVGMRKLLRRKLASMRDDPYNPHSPICLRSYELEIRTTIRFPIDAVIEDERVVDE